MPAAANVFGAVHEYATDSYVFGVVFTFEGANVVTDVITTRLSLRGQSARQINLSGTSALRVSSRGTGKQRHSLIGNSP